MVIKIMILLWNILLLMTFMVGVWAVDIGVSGMLIQGSAIGLYGERSASDQYHIGLMVSLLSIMLMAMINSIYLVLDDRRARS